MVNKLNRRQFLQAVAGLTAGLAISGCQRPRLFGPATPVEPADEPISARDWRLLNRVTFGPRPAERAQVSQHGIAAFIEDQLAPETLAEETWSQWRIRRLESLHMDYSYIFDVPADTVTRELQQATLLRAVYSRRQLYELMVDFWSNHFNISQAKGDCAWLKTIDDREVIRPHALGNFRDLLFASAHSPAMLVYLDNQENEAGAPNENYARELLELHTLGVEGGYSQTDVQELARCLTGWTVKGRNHRGPFSFAADRHDDGAKQILGLHLPVGSKQAGGEQVLEKLALHPTTAAFISQKLVRYFVADAPPQALVEQATKVFLQTQGDIKAILRTILLSPTLLQNPSAQPLPKLKRPFNFIASALRQLNADTDGGQPILSYMAQMGQPLFQWATPDGFPDVQQAWQGTLLTRWQFALALTHNQIPGTHSDLERLAQVRSATSTDAVNGYANLLLGVPISGHLAEQLHRHAEANPAVLLAALLSAPQFQWR